MSDEFKKLDQFLKSHAPRPPAAPMGEKQRIWREIEAVREPPWAAWIPSIRFAAPLAAALAIAFVGLAVHKHRKDMATERILMVALAYPLEELDAPSEAIF